MPQPHPQRSRFLCPVLCPALGAALLLTATGSGCDPVTAKRTTQQFTPVEKGTKVDVRTQNGWIKVIQGRPGLVAITTHRRASALVGKKGLDQMKVQVKKVGSVLRIRGTHPKDPSQRRYQLNFVVKVPPRTKVTLRSARGDLRIFGAICDVDGETHRGEVRAMNVEGTMKLRTHAGNIFLVGEVPRFDVESALGDIRLSLAPTAKPLTGASRAVAKRGDISFTAGPRCGAQVTAQARAGAVKSDWPPESVKPHWLRTQLGTGAATVSLLTHKGRIGIHKASTRVHKVQ